MLGLKLIHVTERGLKRQQTIITHGVDCRTGDYFFFNKKESYEKEDKCLLAYDDVIKWKHFPRYWPFVRGIHR